MSNNTSYGQVLKSTSIMGGAAGINMLFHMLRTKFAAILIGTGGVGLLAIFIVIQNFVTIVAGLGIQSSAVREIAVAAGKDDQQAIGRAVLTLRRICWLTGLAGAAAITLLSPYLSQLTFGNDKYTLEISALGLVIFLTNISGGQMAMIQGMRRIGELAHVNVTSAAISTMTTIGFYVWIGMKGIVPALLASAIVQLLVSWFFARRIAVPLVTMAWRDSFREASAMVRLGLAFMWTALLTSLVAYITNALITHQISLEAVGIYSAAFALSGMFVNFVLTAMGADYFPRLTGVASDKEAMNRMVNEQTEIGLLIAVPGLLATLTLAPWIIHLFYTSDFLPAVNLLQWFVLGCLIRVVQWPMGFIQLALGKAAWFTISQSLFSLLHLCFIWIGITYIGIEGVSIAFFMLYVCSLSVILLIARHLTGFFWSRSIMNLLLIFFPVITGTFLLVKALQIWEATVFGVVLTAFSSIFCLRGLIRNIGSEHRLTRIAFKVPGMRVICGI